MLCMQMEVHVKQVEVKVEGESARPLIAVIAGASGSVSNWSSEVCAASLKCFYLVTSCMHEWMHSYVYALPMLSCG